MKKRRRRKIPLYTKYYDVLPQDDFSIKRIKLLQKVHSILAEEFFDTDIEKIKGDWTIEMSGMTLFLDPINGVQAEITGTFELPILKRAQLHIRLLKLLRRGYGMFRAVNLCLSMLMTQSKNLTNLKN